MVYEKHTEGVLSMKMGMHLCERLGASCGCRVSFGGKSCMVTGSLEEIRRRVVLWKRLDHPGIWGHYQCGQGTLNHFQHQDSKILPARPRRSVLPENHGEISEIAFECLWIFAMSAAASSSQQAPAQKQPQGLSIPRLLVATPHSRWMLT
jgi:hypothetical protein